MEVLDDFETALVAQRAQLFKTAMARTGDRDRAEDLVARTMLRALEARDRFEAGTNLGAWLTTMLTRLNQTDFAQRRRRSRIVLETEDIEFAANNSPHSIPFSVGTKAVEMAFGALPQFHQDTLSLVMNGYRFEDVAEMLDINIGTVKSRTHRARVAVAAALGETLETVLMP